MTWVEFPDKAAFMDFDAEVCADHGIPKPGAIQKTGEDALANQWTTAYVRPIDDNGILKALVPDADVDTYKLIPTTPPPVPDRGEPPITSKPPWDAEIDKPLPRIWEGKPVPTKTSEPKG